MGERTADRLTDNFKLSEFASGDGRPTPEHVKPNLLELAMNLEALRDELKKPIRITSGFRSPEHNAAIKGEPNSFHIKGMAADIQISGVTPAVVAETIERLISAGKMKQGGIGVYKTWVHYDIRGTKARW